MIKISSFAYRSGDAPAGAGKVYDCRSLRNPHRVDELRPLDGRDPAVQAYVARDVKFAALLQDVMHDAVAGEHVMLGCFGGRHRSVAVAEIAASRLRAMGKAVEVDHTALRAHV